MTLTFAELKEKLKQIDEISLLEVLEISSEDIVEKFEDKIEYLYDDLSEDFPDEESTT